jgi:hypothetical protein
VAAPPAAVGLTPAQQLAAGRWGQVFATHLNIPPTIAQADIDNIFRWDSNMTAIDCNHYANAIMELIALPKGRDLIRNIIIAHRDSPIPLPNLQFVRTPHDDVSHIKWNRNGVVPCKINLSYNGGVAPSNGERVLVIRNSSIRRARRPSDQLDFVKVVVPPALVLAHELGHYLYGLNALRATAGLITTLRESYSCVSLIKAIIAMGAAYMVPVPFCVKIVASLISIANFVCHYISRRSSQEAAMACVTALDQIRVKNIYAEVECKRVFADVVNLTPGAVLPPEEGFFIDLWNHGNFVETMNILPSANMMRSEAFNYSDGIMIGEALNQLPVNSRLQFRSFKGRLLNVNTAGVSEESFVRLGHLNPGGFTRGFNGLTKLQKRRFKHRLVMRGILNKIIVNGVPLSPASLPWV